MHEKQNKSVADLEYEKYKKEDEERYSNNEMWNSLKTYEKLLGCKQREKIINEAIEYRDECLRRNTPFLDEVYLNKINDIFAMTVVVALSENEGNKTAAMNNMVYGLNAKKFENIDVINASGKSILGETPYFIRDEDLGVKTHNQYYPLEARCMEVIERLTSDKNTRLFEETSVNSQNKMVESKTTVIKTSYEDVEKRRKDYEHRSAMQNKVKQQKELLKQRYNSSNSEQSSNFEAITNKIDMISDDD